MSDRADLLYSAKNAINSSRIFTICSLYGSSGYYLLNSIFDGHPQLYTFPFSPQYTKIEPDFANAKISKEEAISLIVNNNFLFDTSINKNANNPLNGLGTNRNEFLTLDKKVFESYLTDILMEVKFTTKNFLLAIIASYNYSMGRFPDKSIFIVPAHDIGRAIRYCNCFGEGKIIAMARHPVNCYCSLCKSNVRKYHLDRFHSGRTKHLLYHQPSNLEFLEDYLLLSGTYRDDIGVVLLEELHSNPEQSLKLLASYMDVNFHPSLLESTAGGKLFWGSLNTVVQGFDKNLHRKVDGKYVGHNDTMAIMKMTFNLQKRLGYPNVLNLNTLQKLASKLPSYRYYADRLKLFSGTYKEAQGGVSKIRAIVNTVKDIFFYTLIRLRFDNKRINELLLLDSRVDHGKLKIINPLESSSIAIESSLKNHSKER